MTPHSTVRALLSAQRPDLADLPLGEVLTGWDNHMVRLGGDLAVRLPRRPIAVELLERELDWMPRIAAATGVGVPVPVHRGTAVAGVHDGPWAVLPWTDGTVALEATAEERDRHARMLGELLRRLHVPTPADAPVNPAGRGGPLSGIAARIADRLAAAEATGLLAREQAEEAAVVVKEGLEAPAHGGPDVWIHGDPHAGNTVLGPEGPVLVDWGDLGRGDPASDLGWAWDHCTVAAVDDFWDVYGVGAGEPLHTRARAWAVHYGLIFLAHVGEGRDEQRGRRILTAVLA
jgi:aminoglycoside phosphotransferase (APT) family kinase protein